MPRKNRTTPHIPLSPPPLGGHKRRFATKQQAEAAAHEQMLLVSHLELYVYKGLDGGWYLTRKKYF